MIIDENEYMPVPGGTCTIGWNGGDIDALVRESGGALKREFFENSFPAHEIALQPFLMARMPVSVAQFGVFVRETGYRTEAEHDGWGWVWDGGWKKRHRVSWRDPLGRGCVMDGDVAAERSPVMQVSWNDAAAFCEWLSGSTGRLVRLPDEKEWEAFALLRSGSHDGGNASAMGFLWEWTASWFDRYPGGPSNREFGTVYRVLRGGSSMSHPLQRLPQYRFRRCPTARSPYYGFRIGVFDTKNLLVFS